MPKRLLRLLAASICISTMFVWRQYKTTSEATDKVSFENYSQMTFDLCTHLCLVAKLAQHACFGSAQQKFFLRTCMISFSLCEKNWWLTIIFPY